MNSHWAQVAALASLLWCATFVHAAPLAHTDLTPCSFPDLPPSARCGVLDVPENPAAPAARHLVISFAVIPATHRAARRDPIVPLMGGPGEDALGAAAFYAEQFAGLRGNRDLLLVDQRGSGHSGALNCELYDPAQPAASLRDEFPPEAVQRCENELRTRADLTQYGYSRFARDLERVRQALGYGKLNLFAGSYGTRAAVVYLRAYPASVRTAYLGSVVPIDIPSPLPMAKTSQKALEELFRDCADDTACRGAFPNLRAEFVVLEQRLATGVEVEIPGAVTTAPLSAGRVAEWFRSLLYRPKSAAQLPWLIHQAYLGNWSPTVEGVLKQSRDAELSFGLFFAITCSEDVPFIDETHVLGVTLDTFLGDYRIRQQQAACQPWPKSGLPQDYRKPIESSVPTLFVSGDADGGTPLWFTEHVAPGFSQHAAIVARGQGHTEWSPCIEDLYRRFVLSGSARSLQGATCEPVPRPPFKT